MQHSHTT
jgi:TatD DNase family protein